MIRLAALVAAAWLGAITAADAETVGYRVQLRACQGEACRNVEDPEAVWSGQFACDRRATLIEQRAAVMMDAPFGLPTVRWTVKATCVPVEGMPGA